MYIAGKSLFLSLIVTFFAMILRYVKISTVSVGIITNIDIDTIIMHKNVYVRMKYLSK